jgi:hypothetical protein
MDRDRAAVIKKKEKGLPRVRVTARLPVMSASEVSSGDVLELLSDERVDDGAQETTMSLEMRSPSLISSRGRGEGRLERIERR